MKRYKKAISLVLAGSMLLTGMLSGCSKEEKKEDSRQTPASSDVTWDSSKKDEIILTVINNYYTAGQKKAAEEYMKLHPETKVVVDVVSDNDSYMTKMKTAFSGNQEDASDIIHGNFLVNALTGSSWNLAFEKGYVMDLTPMLDEENPYNDGKLVRDVFEESDLAIALNKTGGSKMGILPFDKIGVAFFYNKDIFEKEGIEIPETFEELENICKEFRDKGYQYPISAGLESSWFLNAIADTGYRMMEETFLVQPGDALWDEGTMKDNENFKFNDADLSCDRNLVNSDERIMAYKKESGVNTDLNKTIYHTFSRVAKYFPENWVQADTNQIITDFEMGNSPMLLQGSFNAGKVLSDINMLPKDQQFEWATFQFPSFEKAPDGLQSTMRGLYVLGNEIAIIQKEDKDHVERVKDFYKYMYSPSGAQMIYEETLTNGNYIQGPSVIDGVTLEEALQEKLDGFVPEGTSRDWDNLDGFTRVTEANKPKFYDLINQFSTEKITAEEMLEQLQPLYDEYNEEAIKAAGYDLDPTTADTPQK